MQLSGSKRLLIACLLLLPIIALGIYTFYSNRPVVKTKDITEDTFIYRPTSAVSDEIASLIEAEDYESAFVLIDTALKDANIPTSRGIPLLALAAQKNNYDLVAVLVAKGADANVPDSNTGETPLIKAARNGNLDMMNLLLTYANADVNTQSRRGMSALTAAIYSGSPAATEFLLARGARTGSTKENMLNFAFQKMSIGVDAMLKTGVSPNVADGDGNTPLLIAASRGDLPGARSLIAYKANINAANKNGNTPLLFSIITQNWEMTDFLLEKGADINKANNNRETPLFWAANFGNTKLVDRFLKLGADYDKVTVQNYTAQRIAERNRHTETAKLIKDFIAYKNIPRDEKGRPIIPKGGAAPSPTSAQQQRQQQTSAPSGAAPAAAIPGMPAMPNMPAMPDMSKIPGIPAGAIPNMPNMPAGFDPSSIPAGAMPSMPAGFDPSSMPAGLSGMIPGMPPEALSAIQQQQQQQQQGQQQGGRPGLRTSTL